MSVKNLFGNNKIVTSKNFEQEYLTVESGENVTQQIAYKNRFIPDVDYSSASNFAFFGSAEEYYTKALYNILNTFPYDGSKKEVTEFLNESSYLDLYIFNNLYPRYNGYAKFSSTGWGTRVGSKVGGLGLGKPSSLEYIYLKGGPHTASSGMEYKPLNDTFEYSNKYDTDPYSTENVLALGRVGSRESNLKTDFDNGITVEFWLKHGAYSATLTEYEAIFDLWNGEASSSANYGRVSFGLFTAVTNNIAIEIMSGSVGVQTAFSELTQAEVTDNQWHHYAIVLQNTGSNLNGKVYYDGNLKDEANLSTTMGEIGGGLTATIGGLNTSPSGSAYDYSIAGDMRGWGKLSGSIDEFRFWKSARTQEQILQNYNSHIGGGTNTDIANTELGVYYKFNEGIVGSSSVDSVVLDYSGRISNGSWVGYPGSTARVTSSAIVEAGVATKEFKDPVVYESHPEFLALLDNLQQSGSFYDRENTSNLYNTLPSWIADEDTETNGELKKLMNIMSVSFDNLYLQTKAYNKVKNNDYDSGYAQSGNLLIKPFPYNDRLLDSNGMDTTELFSNQTLLEYIQNRSINKDYSIDLTEIKNQIYKNIYNNLVYIYKSKGTEKAIRNMLRSIGLNEEFVKLNAYSNNATFLLEDTYGNDTTSKKYISFFHPDRFEATIFQSASANPNTQGRNYISGAIDNNQAFTSEINVLFPYNQAYSEDDFFVYPELSSSVFGLHIVSNVNNFDWKTNAYEDSNFEVYAIKPELYSDQAYFVLKDRANTFEITTSVYKGVYANSEWTFAVKAYNNKYPYYVTGSNVKDYIINFVGYRTEGEQVIESFNLSSSMINASGSNLITANKRYYIGANKTNFTGSTITKSDIKVSSLRHYDTLIDNEAIKVHSIDRSNFGSRHPYESKYVLNYGSTLDNVYAPDLLFNSINIDFENVTGSDGNGKFLVQDFSSGSLALTSRLPTIGSTLYNQHEFTGYGFPASSTSFINREILIGARLRMPEQVNSSDMVRILERDDELFTNDNPVFSMNFALEKSYYGTISQEMLDFYGGVVAFNNIIGEVADTYRDDYSRLAYMRNNFFEKVNNFASIERFYNFYKWIDDSITHFVGQLIPESANFTNNIRDLIESHLLERNKVKHQYPILENKGNTRHAQQTISSRVNGQAERNFKWSVSHPPISAGSVSYDQQTNPQWWSERADTTIPQNTSGDSEIDLQRTNIQGVKYGSNQKSVFVLNDITGEKYFRKQDNFNNLNTPYTFDTDIDKALSIGGNTILSKNINLFRQRISKFSSENNYKFLITTGSQVFASGSTGNVKRYHVVSSYTDSTGSVTTDGFGFENAEHVFPGTFVSSSEFSGYNTNLSADISGLHLDTIDDDLEAPVQGPFTSDHVGGLQYRHQGFNKDVVTQRAEGFKVFPYNGNQGFTITSPQAVSGSDTSNPNLPYAIYTRDETAKRPVNIRNIKFNTTSSLVGNYRRDNEILETFGRISNNRAFVKAEGFSTASINTNLVLGFTDYTKPDRTIISGSNRNEENKFSGSTEHVIVTRFSAPGGPEVAGDNRGGYGLDYESAELSPYNNLNFRNSSVRIPQNKRFLTDHQRKYGLVSGSSVSPTDYSFSGSTALTASATKIFRNSYYKVLPILSGNGDYGSLATLAGLIVGIDTGSFLGQKVSQMIATSYYLYASKAEVENPNYSLVGRNNAWLSTQIPGTEYQYSWIRDSLWYSTTTGYQSRDGLTSYSSSDGYVYDDELNFYPYVRDRHNITSSYNDLFVPLNTTLVDPIDSDNLLLGDTENNILTDYVNYSLVNTIYSTSSVFNALMNRRNGQYGFSTFKQTRVSENNRLVHYLRDNAQFAYSPTPGQTRNSFSSNLVGGLPISIKVTDRFGVTKVATEPPINSNFAPIKFEIGQIKGPLLGKSHIYTADLGSTGFYFNDEKIITDLKINPKVATGFYTIVNHYKNNPDVVCRSVKYKEYLFPSGKNKYTGEVRGRNRFVNNFWRDSLTDRQAKGLEQKNRSVVRPFSFGYNRSSWNLDVFPEFMTYNFSSLSYPLPSPTSINNGFYSGSYSNAGILQNYTSFNLYLPGIGMDYTEPEDRKDIDVQPILARPHLEPTIKSVVSPHGMNIKLSDGTIARNASISSTSSYNTIIGSGMAKWEAGEQAGKYVSTYNNESQTTELIFSSSATKPFYDSYDEYSEDVRAAGKEMAILPEYRVSEFTERILKDNADPGLITDNLSIPFAKDETNTTINSGLTTDFYQVYTNSDFMKYFEVVKKENEGIIEPESITLRCRALKKFLPYNGFYPAERTVEIAQKFYESYGRTLPGSDQVTNIFVSGAVDTISETNKFRPINALMFAPGLLYNAIKSGIAVDYSIFTSSVGYSNEISSNNYFHSPISGNVQKRMPFETLYEPEKHLDGLRIYDNEVTPWSNLNDLTTNDPLVNEIKINSASKTYLYAINNFLAETERFFLAGRSPTYIASANEQDFNEVMPGEAYGMRIKMYRSLDQGLPVSGSWGNYPVPQIRVEAPDESAYYIFLNNFIFQGGPFEYDNRYSGGSKVTGIATRDSALPTLQISISLNGNSNYTIIGTGSTTSLLGYTNNTFNIAAASTAYPGNSNALYTAYNIRDAINSSTGAGAEFLATYVGSVQIPVTSNSTYTTDGYPNNQFVSGSGFSAKTTIGTQAVTYQVIKVKVLDSSTSAEIAIVNSAQPGNWFNPTMDRFCIKAESIGTTIGTAYDDILLNSGTSSFETLSGYPRETLTMYSRPTAFGPPLLAHTASTLTTFSGTLSALNGYNMPYTPPYYDGEAWMDLVYVPGGNALRSDAILSGNLLAFEPFKPTIEKLQKLEVNATPDRLEPGIYMKLWRYDKEAAEYKVAGNGARQWPMSYLNANNNAMQLDASILPFEIIKDTAGNRRWAIKTKFETPILNFNHLTSSGEVFYPTGPVSASVPRGIWHQFGRIPKEDEGVYLQVTDIPSNWLDNHPSASIGYSIGTGSSGLTSGYKVNGKKPKSLASVCKFPTQPFRLGQMATDRKVREAIVAIPFTEELTGGTKHYFNIPDQTTTQKAKIALQLVNDEFTTKFGRQAFDKDEFDVVRNLMKIQSQTPEILDYLETPIGQIYVNSQFYNMPYEFDILENTTIQNKPIAMYMFEFEHKFDQDDLSHMWQNLMPKLGTQMEFAEASIKHPLLTTELLASNTPQTPGTPERATIPDRVKWLVFKVKQKAVKDYSELLRNDPKLTNREKKYSFNWPYDYFSIVELANISAEVEFGGEQITQKVVDKENPQVASGLIGNTLNNNNLTGRLQNLADQQGTTQTSPPAQQLPPSVVPKTPSTNRNINRG